MMLMAYGCDDHVDERRNNEFGEDMRSEGLYPLLKSCQARSC